MIATLALMFLAPHPARASVREIARLLNESKGALVVVFTAPPDEACRHVIDWVGQAVAERQRVHLVDGTFHEEAADFLAGRARAETRFAKFCRAENKGVAIVQRTLDAGTDDAMTAKIGAMIRTDGDRDGWRFIANASLSFVFESRPTAALLGRMTVRDLRPFALQSGVIKKCTYDVFERERLRDLPESTCSARLAPNLASSGWARAAAE